MGCSIHRNIPHNCIRYPFAGKFGEIEPTPVRCAEKFSDFSDVVSLGALKHCAAESKVLAYLIAKNATDEGGLKSLKFPCKGILINL